MSNLSQVELLSDDVYPDWVQELLYHKEVRPFFEECDEVRREVAILLPGGSYYRIDRLVRKDGKWFVIDFKSGEPRSKDEQQVKMYMSVLNEMGYQDVAGILMYIEPIFVKNVA
ncbi:MAG: PD-(D/E)XK nuclease family protein [Bacteroidota bacterium]